MKTITFIEDVVDLMKSIRFHEGESNWSENISENTRVYFLKYIDDSTEVVMETTNGWLSLDEWLQPRGCYLKKHEYEIPEFGTDGVVCEEKFAGSFIDACKYLLLQKRRGGLGLSRRARRKKTI